ncbi:MAG: hypothetical protein J7497_04680, partial [Chitinophagaceae bacterium]|nr:hypothetical protein [Chitinophagaceae bacterium]
MKGPIVVLLFLLPLCVSAQGVFTNQTNTALQKVISDYPNNFRNIRGQMINEDPQTTDYSSNVQIPGAGNAIITKYSSDSNREVYSWKCMIIESEEFEVAAKRYKELYNQIRNSIVKIDGEKPLILNGNYEAPTEEKRFVASSFGLVPANGKLGKVKVELALEFYVTEWKISLLVFDQE